MVGCSTAGCGGEMVVLCLYQRLYQCMMSPFHLCNRSKDRLAATQGEGRNRNGACIDARKDDLQMCVVVNHRLNLIAVVFTQAKGKELSKQWQQCANGIHKHDSRRLLALLRQ
jgi:hypothetical protein